MEFFKLGLRNILGISLPGAIIIIVVSHIIIFFSFFLSDFKLNFLTDNQLLFLIIAFIFSYIIGSLIRLKAADIIDHKSSKNKIHKNFDNILEIIEKFENENIEKLENDTIKKLKHGIIKKFKELDEWKKLSIIKKIIDIYFKKKKNSKNNKIELIEELNKSKKLRIALFKTEFIKLKLDKTLEIPKYKLKNNFEGWDICYEKFDKWIYYADTFPYTLWEFIKFDIYHPKEFLDFFESFKSPMIADGKGFLNYCKMVILSSNSPEGLKNEVNNAEAFSRFLAGTFFALKYSIWMIITSCIIQSVLIYHKPLENTLYYLNFALTIVIAFVFIFSNRLILSRYRNIRLKEVDIVYDAFYLVHKHPESNIYCSTDIVKNENKQYLAREKLLKEIFFKSQKNTEITNFIELSNLIDLIKKRSKNNEFLSSLYFAGSTGDHPFFIRNDKIAIGLSVMPEDSKKAGRSKLHPKQTEIIIVIDGSILLETVKNGVIKEKKIESGEYSIIKKNTCHRISSINNKDSAYIFVKTNPNLEPKSLDCKIEKMPSN